MNIFCTTLLLLFALQLPGFAAEGKKYRVGIDAPYPPFAFTDPATGELTGFDYDIAVALCTKLGWQCDIQVVAFDNIIPSISEGKLDIGVAGMSVNPEREKFVLFSDRYFRSSSMFIEIPGTNTISKEGLAGKKIAVQSKTTQENYLRETYGSVATVVPVTSFPEILQAVKEKQVDIGFIDGLPGYHSLKSEGGDAIDIAGDPIKLGSGSCIVLDKSLAAERDALNKAITDIRSNGKYDEINRKYFDFNVY